MGKAIILIVSGFAVLFAIVGFNLQSSTVRGTQNFIDEYVHNVCKNIANAGMNTALEQLRLHASWRTGFSNLPFSRGTATVSLVDTNFSGTWHVKITSVGSFMGRSDTVRAIVKDSVTGFLPPTVKAAITSNASVVTSGSFVVDARDHDLNGTLVSSTGTLGIYTTQSYTQQGNSQVGGTYDSVDYAPAKVFNSNLVVQNAFWPGGFPATPDQAMGGAANGYADGTLLTIAQSGVNGSQYVTDPSQLHFPLSGVTYVDYGGIWNPADLGNSTGILVVHNVSTSAVMKNVQGSFKGLIIADRIDHVNANTVILGAVIGLSSIEVGNTFGNGDGTVLYSRQALLQCTSTAGVNGNARAIVQIESYWE